MNDADFLELDALCQALADGALTPAQRDRLSGLLRTSEDARRHYVRSIALAASLCHYAGEMQAEAPDDPRQKLIRPALWRWGAGLLATAAAIALGLWLGGPAGPAAPERIVRDRDSGDSIARISGAADAQWIGTPLRVGDELRPAERLDLAAGAAEITFDSGAQLVLEGPASLQLTSAWGASLSRGTVRATVPPEAVGFRVTSSAVEVTDLGTEFSLVADATSGAAEVFVHKGAVETSAPGSERAPLVLREKQSRRFARAGGSAEIRDPEAQFVRLSRRIAFQRSARPAGTVAWSFDAPGGMAAHAVLTALPGTAPISLALRNPVQVDGRYGRALRLDGRAFGTASVPGLSGRNARMVALWIRIPPDADLSESGPVVSWPLGVSDPRSFSLGWNRDPAAGLIGAWRARAARRTLIGTTPLQNGRWHHIAAMLVPAPHNDAAYQLKTYVDGRLEAPSARLITRRRGGAASLLARSSSSRTVPGDPDTLYVGGDPSGARFRGDVDELVIADRPLVPREIASLFRENRIPLPDLLAAE
jgi:concanavalin A-like lectin/glucanase superfamily protein/FecR-like protein